MKQIVRRFRAWLNEPSKRETSPEPVIVTVRIGGMTIPVAL